MNLKRIILRSWFYFRTGYTLYLSFPIAFLGYASAIYYLAVQSIPFLERVFPHFYLFLVASLFSIPPLGIFIGWMHYKRLLSPLYKAEMDVQIEANPYATMYKAPIDIPFMKFQIDLGKKLGIDTSELEEVLKITKEKFGRR